MGLLARYSDTAVEGLSVCPWLVMELSTGPRPYSVARGAARTLLEREKGDRGLTMALLAGEASELCSIIAESNMWPSSAMVVFSRALPLLHSLLADTGRRRARAPSNSEPGFFTGGGAVAAGSTKGSSYLPSSVR